MDELLDEQMDGELFYRISTNLEILEIKYTAHNMSSYNYKLYTTLSKCHVFGGLVYIHGIDYT